jgi:hypothetical protein
VHITLSKKFLGTPYHLIYDGSVYAWSDDIPDDSWLLGFNEPRDLSLVAEMLGMNLSTFQSSIYGVSIDEIFESSQVIPWIHVIPRREFNSILSDLLGQLWGLCKAEGASYYLNRFISNRELLRGLHRPLIGAAVLNKIAQSETLKRGEILKFSPDESGYAKRTEYNLIKSSTGRLTVSSGPNILTLKKTYRKIIKSRFDNGKIIQADIVSLEPRIALAIAGKEIPEDIYEYTRLNLLKSAVTRQQAKIITLSCIYGSSSWALEKQLPNSLNAKDVIRRVRSYFNIDNLDKVLTDQYNKLGYITNAYGRRLDPGDAIVNRYLQSTGVDVSFEVFEDINKKVLDKSDECLPIFVIHDAELFDSSKSSVQLLKDITKDGIYIDSLQAKFPIKLEVIE